VCALYIHIYACAYIHGFKHGAHFPPQLNIHTYVSIATSHLFCIFYHFGCMVIHSYVVVVLVIVIFIGLLCMTLFVKSAVGTVTSVAAIA